MKRNLFMLLAKKPKNLLMLAAALLFLFMAGSAWAGSVSGTVYDSDGFLEVQIGVSAYSYRCDSEALQTVYTNANNGTYSMSGLPDGDVYLRTDNLGNNYVNEWWYSTDTPQSVIPCNEAQATNVQAGVEMDNRNFELDTGGFIQGTVLDGNGDTLSGVSLSAVLSYDLSQWKSSATSDEGGEYSITGLPPDTYNVMAQKLGYGSTYYGGYSDEQRRKVFVTDETQYPATVNFVLQTEGTISGQVTDGVGNPVEGAAVLVHPFDGGYGHSVNTNGSGNYIVGQLSTGAHAVRVTHPDYSQSYYLDAHIWNKATKVMVTSVTNPSNIDISLAAAGGISGTVADAGEAVLANVRVRAYNDPCWANFSGESTSETDGFYSISGLPPGTYYLWADANNSVPQHYVTQWWKNGTGTDYCDEAGAITVSAGATTSGNNFYLPADTTVYHAPAFKYAGVFYERLPDGSVRSGFYAFISGPAPIDVQSLTATGHSGTFTLTPNVTFIKDLGLMYWAGSNSIVTDGTYTFSLTDSQDRTVTTPYTLKPYNSSVPGINSASMSPADQAYVGTTTPTLSFTRVSGVSSHQVFVWDLKGNAVWYQKDITDSANSVTVPSGILQANTPYQWWVRTKDSTGSNRVKSEIRTFFTGTKGAPDINSGGVLSFPDAGVTGGTIYGFMYGRSNTLAPWDISYFKVTDNLSNYFYIDYEMGFIGNASYYNFAQIGYKTQPLIDGTYNYQIQDRTDGSEYDVNVNYQYDPTLISNFSESTRTPAIFSYVNTNRPTFSWGALSGAGGYRLRIYDYDRRLRLYHSPPLTGTSFRIPEGVNLPWGSTYRWQVQAWDNVYGNNFTHTVRAPFTIPPLATYNYTLPGGNGTVTSFRMFTAPLYLGTIADVLKMMETTLGTYVTEGHGRWRVFMYVNSQYVEINDASIADNTHSPDKVFWIISLDQTQVPFSGGGAPSALYTCTLGSNSWQTFGLPWDSPAIELGKIGVTDGTTTRFITDTNNALTAHVVWEYTGGTADNGYVQKILGDTLTPGTGYFISVDSANSVQLLIPPNNDGGYFTTNSNDFIQPGNVRENRRELPPPPPGG